MLRLDDALEEHVRDAHVIVEIFDGTEMLDRRAGMQVQLWRAVRRKRRPMRIGQRGGAQEARETCSARRVRLERVNRACIEHAPKIPVIVAVLARSTHHACWRAVADEMQPLQVIR